MITFLSCSQWHWQFCCDLSLSSVIVEGSLTETICVRHQGTSHNLASETPVSRQKALKLIKKRCKLMNNPKESDTFKQSVYTKILSEGPLVGHTALTVKPNVELTASETRS